MYRPAFGIHSRFGIQHNLRSLRLHVVPSCRFVQHELLELVVIKVAIDSFCLFMCVILDQTVDHRRFAWRIQDLFRQAGNEK